MNANLQDSEYFPSLKTAAFLKNALGHESERQALPYLYHLNLPAIQGNYPMKQNPAL